jgi:hypothetical protein
MVSGESSAKSAFFAKFAELLRWSSAILPNLPRFAELLSSFFELDEKLKQIKSPRPIEARAFNLMGD